MRINFTEEAVRSANSVFDVLFPDKRTRASANLFMIWFKGKKGRASKSEISRFSRQLASGKLLYNSRPIRYSRRNFYGTVVKALVDLGFIQRNVPAWDDRAKKTVRYYVRNIFDIPKKPPSVGFWRLCYYMCRMWNEEFEGKLS